MSLNAELTAMTAHESIIGSTYTNEMTWLQGCTTKKDTPVTFWAKRIFSLSFLWHFYDDNYDKPRYHHRCGGVLLL